MGNDHAGMIVFRKSGKGYNKDDVNKYIEEMNIRFKSEVDSLKSEISKLSSSTQASEDDSSQKANDETESQLASLQNEIEQLKLINKAISDENKHLNELIQKQSAMYEDAVSQNSSNGSNNDDPFVDVKVKADQILSDADVAARLITDRVQKHLSSMTDNYESVLLTGALDSLKDIEESFLNARVKVKEIQFRMEDTLKSISSSSISSEN